MQLRMPAERNGVSGCVKQLYPLLNANCILLGVHHSQF
jgi:hypothetical protein